MPCEELSFDGFGEQLRVNLQGRRGLLSATLGLTDRCNLRCVHCFVHEPDRDREIKDRELSTAQWMDILDQLTEMGCLSLLFTGGEPLLRDDFVEIYTHAKRRGFLITLFTNGTLLTRELVDFLSSWYPYLIEVTLYGLTVETYGAVTGNPGAFERCMRGVEMLVEAGLPLRLKAMAMRPTAAEIPAMYEYAAGLGVPFRHDGMVWQPLFDKDVSELRLTPAEIVELDRLQPIAASDFVRVHERHLRIVASMSDEERRRLYNCGGGHQSCYVDPYGVLSICQAVRPGVYDLTDGNLREGWGALGTFRATTLAPEHYACRECEIAGLCPRCPARSLREHSDPAAAVEFACKVTRLRAEQLGLDLTEWTNPAPMGQGKEE